MPTAGENRAGKTLLLAPEGIENLPLLATFLVKWTGMMTFMNEYTKYAS